MRILSVLVLLSFTALAQAQIVVAPSISYISDKTENNGSNSETTYTFLDGKIGYLHASGLFLGGMYSSTKISTGSSSLSGFAVGPTLGYSHYSGFYAMFTYFLLAEQDLDSTNTLKSGMGPQIDMGWAFPITAMFHLGPQISYRSIKYDKIDPGSVSTDYTWSRIYPSLILWFNF